METVFVAREEDPGEVHSLPDESDMLSEVSAGESALAEAHDR